METKTFVFFGQVGSGKGTQVKLLTDFLKNKDSRKVVYAGTGEEFRKLIKAGGYVADLIKETILQGKLQPNFLTTSLFTNILVNSLTDEKHFIADGYPRTVEQSEDFNQMMNFFNRKNIQIIYIELSEEEAMRRNLARGRTDDTEEGIRERFNEYKNNVIPAMNYFQDKDNYQIYNINGAQSIEAVHQDIAKALNL